ncbi:zinc finger protein 271-like [Morone saxatilis]|uniref:zinc finger protein 271-like n=1 Tax=Morone saxatilis TaxID=34816 RepID=UPI0015E20405|nr:zinc finger protein 271-like [Morone saxatilis]
MAKSDQNVSNLHKYECPDCGMLFIRRARLLGHLRVHRSHESSSSKPPRCDQCNKNFTSEDSWMAHVDLHKQKPFWCLSCAKGFSDEASLDKHLQNHSLKKHTCNICHKSFHVTAQLKHHYNTHTGAKPYQCTVCGKNFSFPGNLISHRKKHHAGSNGMPVGLKNSAIIGKKRLIKKKRLILTSVKEEPEMDINIEELPAKKERGEESDTQKPCEDAEFGDYANSEESDCGEPVHYFNYFKPSKPPGPAGSDPPHELKSEIMPPQAGQGPDESESQETNMHRVHKYWEWECCECDMGFDEVAKLHLHYIKHATGELPIPQDDIEG